MDEIGNGKLEPTLADAHKYLTNVRDVASSQSTGDGTVHHRLGLGDHHHRSDQHRELTRRWAFAAATPNWVCW